ncbi:hypothetical protein RUND412_008599 [Rhizina undulata]
MDDPFYAAVGHNPSTESFVSVGAISTSPVPAFDEIPEPISSDGSVSDMSSSLIEGYTLESPRLREMGYSGPILTEYDGIIVLTIDRGALRNPGQRAVIYRELYNLAFKAGRSSGLSDRESVVSEAPSGERLSVSYENKNEESTSGELEEVNDASLIMSRNSSIGSFTQEDDKPHYLTVENVDDNFSDNVSDGISSFHTSHSHRSVSPFPQSTDAHQHYSTDYFRSNALSLHLCMIPGARARDGYFQDTNSDGTGRFESGHPDGARISQRTMTPGNNTPSFFEEPLDFVMPSIQVDNSIAEDATSGFQLRVVH